MNKEVTVKIPKEDFDKAVESGVEQAMKECELTIGMTLKEAVEKQIPHKLAPKRSKGCEVPVCGKCGGIMDLMQGELNYCPNCGQRLKWG